jgi:hypothetical protein
MALEMTPTASKESVGPLRALCVARHSFLSEHLARYFAQMGIATTNAVGLDSAAKAAADASPDVVICDFDVLASIPLHAWQHDVLLSSTPVIAVSLTRHAEELQLLDVNGIAGFFYLPTLEKVPALRILHAAAARPRYSYRSGARAPRTVDRS